ARQERHAEQGDGAEKIRPKDRGHLRNPRAPVMADDDRRFTTQRIDEPNEVARQLENVIGLNFAWTSALPIAAHIGRKSVEGGICQSAELMAPRVPRFRKAVTHQDERAGPAFGTMYPNAVSGDEPMGDVSHESALLCCLGHSSIYPSRDWTL